MPVWSDAKARGYDRAFLEQYTGWLKMIRAEFQNELDHITKYKPPTPPAVDSVPVPPPTAAVPAVKTPYQNSWKERGALEREPLSGIIRSKKWTDRSLAISTYLPILISVIAIIGCIAGLIAAMLRRDPETKERFLYPLAVLGCALALFPQFYFFRPDTPHLSEMMVPFLAALALFVWVAARYALRDGSVRIRASAGFFAALCLAAGGIYFSHAFPKESSGSIAAKKKVSQPFRALNGVNVMVRDQDAAWLAKLRDAILRYSYPGEYVMCLPYSPTINFMTDRPSPMRNLYVDNTVGEMEFRTYFLKLVSETPPAVVVVDQRKINGTEISRFRNWAPQTYEWLWKNYVFVGRYSRNEVFVRPGKPSDGMVPEYISVSD